jgi:hypothetical protein
MSDWVAQVLAREEAAKLIIDQRTLWRLVHDAKPRNRVYASWVSDWLLDHDQREPDFAPSRQEILDRDARFEEETGR